MKCPVCDQYEFEYDDDFDICSACGWENDGIQNADPDYKGGANHISLNEAKAQFKETKKRLIKRSHK